MDTDAWSFKKQSGVVSVCYPDQSTRSRQDDVEIQPGPARYCTLLIQLQYNPLIRNSLGPRKCVPYNRGFLINVAELVPR